MICQLYLSVKFIHQCWLFRLKFLIQYERVYDVLMSATEFYKLIKNGYHIYF